MQIIILGAGRVGMRTARVLRTEGHEVTVIDTDRDRIQVAAEDGFSTVFGDGSHEEVLLEGGVESAAAIGALTGDLNVNFAACSIAKYHTTWTVMRVDIDHRERVYHRYADEIDEVVYPERLGAIGAKNALLGGSVRAIADVAQNLQVVIMEVTEKSPMRGYTIEELALPGGAEVLAFGKADAPMRIPLADDSLAVGDRMAVLADFDVLEETRQLIVGQKLVPDREVVS